MLVCKEELRLEFGWHRDFDNRPGYLRILGDFCFVPYLFADTKQAKNNKKEVKK